MLEFLAAAEGVCPSDRGSAIISIISIAKSVVRILQIAVPIALIIWGTVDLGKAVIAGEEKKIKESQGTFVKRIVAAVIVFIIPWLVNFVMAIVSSNEWWDCWKQAGSKLDGTNSIGEKIRHYNF